jgi:Tfp pilus assembly protein PilV
MMMPARPAAARPGMSLLEVLTALAIFLFSLIALGRLIGIGTDMAIEARDLGRGSQLAQSKLNELVTGIATLNGDSGSFDGADGDWTWSVDAESDSTAANLWNVTVTVTHNRPDGSEFTTSLSQKVLDPNSRGTFDGTNTPLTASGSSGTSGSSSTTTTTTGSSGSGK